MSKYLSNMREGAKEYERNWVLYHDAFGNDDNVNEANDRTYRFTKNADIYEETILKLNYTAPQDCAKATLRLLKYHGDDVKVLDVACGTGLVGKELRSLGFKGVVDGNDSSEGMLEHAKKANVYRSLNHHILNKETPLKIADNMYDAVICCGSFGIGKIQPDCIKELIRVVKKGGLVVLTMRPPEDESHSFPKLFYSEVGRLIEENVWKEEEIVPIYYFANVQGGKFDQNTYHLRGSLRSYIKSK